LEGSIPSPRRTWRPWEAVGEACGVVGALDIFWKLEGPQDPLECLWPVADRVVEAPEELPLAEAEFVGRPIDAHTESRSRTVAA
jgi:hypothetical protein